jgi:filamentous hemagglutinin family protein
MAHAGMAFGLLLAACGAWAQTGNLGLVVRDGSIGPEVLPGETGVVLPGDGADYLIYQELGELSGRNLFHSFDTFSIGVDEIARFTGSDIDNIVSRVNGTTFSNLLGKLESTVPGANIFLLNPNGVYFGPSSELNVQGSFYASTADVLHFDNDVDGDFFAREKTPPEAFSWAAPASFGFLQEPTGVITFDRAQLAVNEGRTLSAVGGEIKVFGGSSPSLKAPGGRVQLVSMASPVDIVELDASKFDVDRVVAEGGALGNVSLTDGAVLQVDSESSGSLGTGRIVIRGGQFIMVGGGLYAKTNNANPGNATAVDVAVTGDISLSSRASIQSWSKPGGGATGDIELAANQVVVQDDRTSVAAVTQSAAPGAGVDVDANWVTVDGGAQIFTRSSGDGNAGTLSISGPVIEGEGEAADRAENVALIGAAKVWTTGSAAGDGGRIEVAAQTLEVTSSAITSLTNAGGTGGAIEVRAANVRVTDGGQIASETKGGGPGGAVSVTADGELELAGEGQITTLAASTARGRGGDLTVRAGSVKVTGGEDPDFVAQISALTDSKGQLEEEGRGGDLTIEAGSVELTDGGQIRATTNGDAAAGDLTLTVLEDLRLPSSDCQGVCISGVSLGGARPSGIFATSGSDPDAAEQATGDGGDVVVNAQFVQVESGGEIGASTLGTGNAGSLTLWDQGENAQLVSIRGDSDGERSAVATQGTQGSGGNLTIFADDLELVDGGEVSASTLGAGDAGSVVIEAQRILIQGENLETPSGVFAKTVVDASGNAGSIDVTAHESLAVVDGGKISVASEGGGGFAGDLMIRGGGSVEVARGGEISALTAGPVREASPETASDIVIADAAQLTVSSGGTITAETFGEGFGGSISIHAQNVALSGGARITAQTSGLTPDAGPAGDISITEADQISLTSGATITTETSGNGAGGSITVSGADVSLSGGARITAASTSTEAGAGDGGDILFRDGDALTLSGGSKVTAETLGKGQGGSITIRDIGNVLLKGNSSITTNSTSDLENAGDAGAIVIAATSTFHAENSEITTTARADDAGGGRISIQARDLVYFLDSLVETTVEGETAGADAGDIFIPLGGEEAVGIDPVVPEFVVINRSVVRANAVASGAGDITINGRNVLISADSVIEATSEQGVSGEIQISSPDRDIASQVAQLPSSFVDPSDRILPPCAARTERTGSFMVQNREALPRSLDAPLPSNLTGAPGAPGAPGVDGIPPASGSTDCSVFPERS